MLDNNQIKFVGLVQTCKEQGLKYKTFNDEGMWFTLEIEGIQIKGVCEISPLKFDCYDGHIFYTHEGNELDVDLKLAEMLIKDHAMQMRMAKILLK